MEDQVTLTEEESVENRIITLERALLQERIVGSQAQLQLLDIKATQFGDRVRKRVAAERAAQSMPEAAPIDHRF
jgi:hypothetical protein